MHICHIFICHIYIYISFCLTSFFLSVSVLTYKAIYIKQNDWSTLRTVRAYTLNKCWVRIIIQFSLLDKLVGLTRWSHESNTLCNHQTLKGIALPLLWYNKLLLAFSHPSHVYLGDGWYPGGTDRFVFHLECL